MKTFNYLGIIIDSFPKTLVQQFLLLPDKGKNIKQVIKQIAITDVLYLRQTYKTVDKYDLKPQLFFVFDTTISVAIKDRIDNLVTVAKSCRLYETTYYVKNSKSVKGDVVLVMNIPEDFHNAFYKFLKCEYSEMYTSSDFKRLNLNAKELEYPIFKVLRLQDTELNVLKQSVKTKFGTSILPDTKEQDINWDFDDEVLHSNFATSGEIDFFKTTNCYVYRELN